jgi:signal transduction histidine kinase/CheY-like chemotaxis protein/ligand-binding sensor domain-containing protein
MSFQLRTLLLFYFSLSFSTLFSQDYRVDIKEINIKKGLPNRVVYDLVQDKQGFIWASFKGMISRYDGYKFKTYDHNFLKTSDGNPLSLAVDKNNYIWYCKRTLRNNFGGAIDPQTDSIHTLESITNGLIKSNELIQINYSITNKKVWFLITRQGLVYKYDNGLELVHEFKITGLLQSIYFDIAPDGSKWLLFNRRVIRTDPNGQTQTFHLDPSIKEHLNNRIIQFTPNVLLKTGPIEKSVYWNFTEAKFIPPRPSNISKTNVLQAYKDYQIIVDKKTIFAQNRAGQIIWQYTLNNQSHFHALRQYRTTLIDKQNMLWVGTNNGLFKIVQYKNPFKISQRGNSIRGIYQNDRFFWTGGYAKNIQKNLKTGSTRTIIPSPQAITGFTQDQDGHIWIGSVVPRLFKYTPLTDSVKAYINHQLFNLNVPYENQQTGKLWIGTSEGLMSFDKDKEIFQPYQLPINSNSLHIRQFYKNKAGIWIISNKGLFLMDTQEETILKHYTTKEGFPTNNLIHLYEDQQGDFWIGTKRGGLIHWDKKQNKFRQFDQEYGLSNNTIYAVYEDDYDQLWLPSDYGLNCFNKKTLINRVYFPKNGIAHEEFNMFSHFQSADGTLFFGGLNGITSFHPKDLQRRLSQNTPLHITKVNILEKDGANFTDKTNQIVAAKSINLSAKVKILNLEFSLLDYEESIDNQYAYRIEGFQNNWIYTKENKISFINLPYGHYTLAIKGRSPTGHWSNEAFKIPLIIKKPFYLQESFILGLLLLAIIAIIAFIKGRTIILEKDKKKLEMEVKKRTFKIEQDRQTILSQAEELKELDQMKTQFITNITHEFRTPLTLIISPLQQIIKGKDEKVHKDRLKGVLKNANSILALIDQLLDLSKLGARKMKTEMNQNNIIAYTSNLLDGFRPLSDKKSQRLIFIKQVEVWDTWFDHDKWNKIINNLLLNAIKFTPENGVIQVSLSKIQDSKGNWISLNIRDNGIGIAADHLPHIFDRFYQIDSSPTRAYQGTGIGLSVVKALIEAQSGSIEVKSILNKGTTFKIKLPIPKIHSITSTSPVIVNEVAPSEKQKAIIVKSKETVSKDQFKILIIEDHPEMQAYIQESIRNEKYAISTALNGLEGIKKAEEIIPDLIISDIMMPQKDGYEVVQAIRNKLSTSHIPIILLTAKVSSEAKLTGLERGADAYLTKPFSPEELNIRILKLIEIRQLIQKKYQNKVLKKEIIQLPIIKKETVFINKLKKYILANISDPALNGETISQNFKMSRMQLHRKLKALCNQSTSEFILTTRLEHAYELLETGEHSVKEVTYDCGFSSPSYFSRVFKQKYEKVPSEVLK